jgi:hypothetical protein
MTRPSAVLCALLLSSATSARAEKTPVYALTGGRVVTVSGPIQEGATVVLRDGVVEAVGSGVKIPADARVIDAKGLTLTPGLIDGFGGIGLPAAGPPRGGPGGGGGGNPPAPRDATLAPQTLVLDKIRAADALKARDSGFTTALVIPREGVLPGRSVLLSLSGETPEQMAWKEPAALHLHMTTLSRQYPGSLMGTMAYARQALTTPGATASPERLREGAFGQEAAHLRPGARSLGRRALGPDPADRHRVPRERRAAAGAGRRVQGQGHRGGRRAGGARRRPLQVPQAPAAAERQLRPAPRGHLLRRR